MYHHINKRSILFTATLSIQLKYLIILSQSTDVGDLTIITIIIYLRKTVKRKEKKKYQVQISKTTRNFNYSNTQVKPLTLQSLVMLTVLIYNHVIFLKCHLYL